MEPIRITSAEKLGRFTVANCNLGVGELIVKEPPLVIGPAWHSPLCCLNCYRPSLTICKQCKAIPLCFNCKEHLGEECKLFQQSKIDRNFLIDNFNVVTPLRCLLLLKNESNGFQLFNKLMEFESHIDRFKGTDIWIEIKSTIVDPLMKIEINDFFPEPMINEETIFKICCILNVNSFAITRPLAQSINLSGLYQIGSLCNHSCKENTFLSVDDDFNFYIYAGANIMKEEPILVNYTDPLQGTIERRSELLSGKQFLCECKRCCDPTEFGTFLSSVSCSKCQNQVDLDVTREQWKCIKCGTVTTKEAICSIISEARYKVYDENDNITGLKELIELYSKKLSPNHYIVLSIKNKLMRKLKMIIDLSSDISEEILCHQLKLCNDILNIISRIAPTISRLKGITLLCRNNVNLKILKLNIGDDSFEIKDKQMQLMKSIGECINILKFERNSKSAEAIFLIEALEQIKQLKRIKSQ